MKQTFSPKWISSKQPRKQRKYRHNAPLHVRRSLMSAHLDKALRKVYRKRSVPLRVDDEVVVVRGDHRKKRGKVTEIDTKRLKIFVDGVKRKKVSGQEIQIPIDPSNVVITALKTDDKKRLKMLRRKDAVSEAGKKEAAKIEKKKTHMDKEIGDIDKEAARQMEEAKDRAEDKRSKMLDKTIGIKEQEKKQEQKKAAKIEKKKTE